MKKAIFVLGIIALFGLLNFASAQTTCSPLLDEFGQIVELEGNWAEDCSGNSDIGLSFGQANYNCDANGENCDTHAYICDGLCTSSSGGSKQACVLKENPDTGAEYCNPFACIGPKKCRLFSPQLKYGLSYQEFTEAWENPESPFYHYGKNSTAYFGWLVFTAKKCACATQATVDAYYDTSTTSGSSEESSPEPTPTPTVPEITSFEITNFKKQQSGSGLEYYQCLKEQMAIQHPDYQLNLAWEVMGADSCTASCKYARVDDYLQNQDFGALPGQAWDCSSDIDGNVTFSGSVDNVSGSAKTKPKENGVIQYALSCESGGGSDREDLEFMRAW